MAILRHFIICLAVYMRIELISLGRQPRRITITPIDRYLLKRKGKNRIANKAFWPTELYYQRIDSSRIRTCVLPSGNRSNAILRHFSHFSMVLPTGLEPAIFAVKGQRLNQFVHRSSNNLRINR